MRFFMVAALALSFTSITQAQSLKGNVRAGQKKVELCIGCHGIPNYQASFPVVYRVPKIFGQSEQYLVEALMAYRKGDRKHPSMIGIGNTLNDQDIADIAAYYASAGDQK